MITPTSSAMSVTMGSAPELLDCTTTQNSRQRMCTRPVGSLRQRDRDVAREGERVAHRGPGADRGGAEPCDERRRVRGVAVLVGAALGDRFGEREQSADLFRQRGAVELERVRVGVVLRLRQEDEQAAVPGAESGGVEGERAGRAFTGGGVRDQRAEVRCLVREFPVAADHGDKRAVIVPQFGDWWGHGVAHGWWLVHERRSRSCRGSQHRRGIAIGVGRAHDEITDRASTDGRAAACPPTRSCASRAMGTAVTVGGAMPAGTDPLRRWDGRPRRWSPRDGGAPGP